MAIISVYYIFVFCPTCLSVFVVASFVIIILRVVYNNLFLRYVYRYLLLIVLSLKMVLYIIIIMNEAYIYVIIIIILVMSGVKLLV